MMYEFKVNDSRYLVEVEKHNYRYRFYGIRANGLEDWERHGYIGSYYPAMHECGFVCDFGNREDVTFKADARGPKTAAKILLVAFLNQLNAVEV